MLGVGTVSATGYMDGFELPDGFINNLPNCAQLESTMGSDSGYGIIFIFNFSSFIN